MWSESLLRLLVSWTNQWSCVILIVQISLFLHFFVEDSLINKIYSKKIFSVELIKGVKKKYMYVLNKNNNFGALKNIIPWAVHPSRPCSGSPLHVSFPLHASLPHSYPLNLVSLSWIVEFKHKISLFKHFYFSIRTPILNASSLVVLKLNFTFF
jgi:hypothetical protein